MVSLEKLLKIIQGIGKKFKNIGLEKFRLSIRNESGESADFALFFF
jgi:hypothetical protein